MFGYLLIVLLQWSHFALYYRQPFGLSLLWSVVDWSVWFALAIGVISHQKFKCQWYACLGFILLAGPAHILLSTSIYHILYQADKTILESFFHLMNKRWLQNVFIASIAILLTMYLRQRFEIKKTQKHSAEKEQPLVLDDGKHTYQLKGEDVLAVVAAKNYLSVFTADKEIIVRDTLKNMQNRLAADQFIQVSRSALVKRSEVSQIERYSKTSFRAVLSNQHTVNIGRTFADSVQQSLRLSPQSHHSSL